MTHSLRKQCWRFVRLLFAACLPAVFLAGNWVPLQADERRDTRDGFVELDREIQAIKEDILAINRDILLLEELSLYPYGEQLVVLVSLATDSPLNPGRITLQLDGQTVSQHAYSASEGAALQAGGAHRLYFGRLGEGEHTLDVSLVGRVARDKAFEARRSVTITKMAGRKTVELELGSVDESSESGVTIRQWQQ